MRFHILHDIADLLERGDELGPLFLGVFRNLGGDVIGAECFEEIFLHQARVIRGGGMDFLGVLVADFREEDGDAIPSGGVGRVVNETQ